MYIYTYIYIYLYLDPYTYTRASYFGGSHDSLIGVYQES